MAASHRFYADLAPWWPLISPVGDYAGEAAEYLRVLADVAPTAKTLLELGSGGGHNAFYMKARYQLTLTDLSEPMLALSRRLNPECEHLAGDMRTVALDRAFDIVFVHDATDYMATERDLADAVATAARHCAPGGVVLIVPDHLKETYVPSTDHGGDDGRNGEGSGTSSGAGTPMRPTTTAPWCTAFSFASRMAAGRRTPKSIGSGCSVATPGCASSPAPG